MDNESDEDEPVRLNPHLMWDEFLVSLLDRMTGASPGMKLTAAAGAFLWRNWLKRPDMTWGDAVRAVTIPIDELPEKGAKWKT